MQSHPKPKLISEDPKVEVEPTAHVTSEPEFEPTAGLAAELTVELTPRSGT